MPKPGELQRFKADFFRALAHPVRIRLLEELAVRERSVHDLQQALDMPQPLVSQQLAILRTHQLVVARKVGTSMVYSLRDPLVTKLLGIARRVFDNRLSDTTAMLKELRREPR